MLSAAKHLAGGIVTCLGRGEVLRPLRRTQNDTWGDGRRAGQRVNHCRADRTAVSVTDPQTRTDAVNR